MSEHEISQEILIAEYEAVYYYVLSLCHNSSEAEDITQETFCRALYKKTEFKGNSSIYTWLCAIARNIWLKKIKKEKRNVSDEVLYKELEWNGETVESMIINQETLKTIHKILHTMDEPYKEVFSLRTFGELPFRDIADLFGKSESWARVVYYRAKQKILDQWLEEYKQENCYRLGIVLKENNKLIGMIDVVGYKEDQPVVGYVLNQNYWGHGYMTEAFSGVIGYLKEQRFHKIYIEADQRNIGSNRVIQKNGFTFTHQETKPCSSFKPNLITVNWYERVLD